MRHFRVLHNFDAQDAVELTVKKGEIVLAVDGEVQEGWIKVEVPGDLRRRGFVPFNHLRETRQSVARKQEEEGRNIGKEGSDMTAAPTSHQLPTIPKETTPTFTSAAFDYGDRLQNMYGGGASDPCPMRQQSGSVETAPRRGNEPAVTTAVVTGPVAPCPQAQPLTSSAVVPVPEPSLLSNPNAIIEAFMKNELHFKQLVRQRQDALAQMRTTVEEAVAELEACREKNATLARKLRDLDQSVEKERGRWKERIMEEKAYINRSLSSD
ncbi:SH3 domain protein [Trypanosoma rangeli]|uniref:SH3 domain protein n=1 Tax=Trypanosoma rangeli TaxID=5698 RepID=A0A422NLQ1_TRYRA|nr:SH3 domain protein [Trypanosoma rangeli]RNF06422.1 SH3 domain protein [Trypanosoma rangeli]|eukprot:RNF06422.1 SH3 domain protein [Trypanosoma rangeli]